MKINPFKYLTLGFVTLVVVFSYSKALAQDFTSYEPVLFKSYSNPALVSINGENQLLMAYQRKLLNVPSEFSSKFVSLDYNLKENKQKLKLGGVGLYISDDMAGETNYRISNFGTRFSVFVPITSRIEFRTGFNANYKYTAFDPSKVVLGDQLDPYLGIVIPSSPSLASDMENSIGSFNLGFGFNLSINLNKERSYWYNKHLINIGLAFNNLLREPNSFIGDALNETNNFKYVFNIDYFTPLEFYGPQLTIDIQPYLFVEKAGSMQNTCVGASMYYEGFILGTYLRHQQFELLDINTLAFSGGAVIKSTLNYDISINYSYAIPKYNSNIAVLNNAHEVSLVYNFGKHNYNNNPFGARSNSNYHRRYKPSKDKIKSKKNCRICFLKKLIEWSKCYDCNNKKKVK